MVAQGKYLLPEEQREEIVISSKDVPNCPFFTEVDPAVLPAYAGGQSVSYGFVEV